MLTHWITYKNLMITVGILVIPILLMRKLRYTEVTKLVSGSKESNLGSLTQVHTLNLCTMSLNCYKSKNTGTNLTVYKKVIY